MSQEYAPNHGTPPRVDKITEEAPPGAGPDPDGEAAVARAIAEITEAAARAAGAPAAGAARELGMTHRLLSKTRNGYRAGDVDSFAAQAITAVDLAEKAYSQSAAEARRLEDDLAGAAAALRASEAQVKARDRSLTAAQQELAELRSGASDAVVRMRVAERMASVQEDAERVIAAAQARAAQVVEDARRRAAGILAAAPAMAVDAQQGAGPLPSKPATTGDRVGDALATARWLGAVETFVADTRTAAMAEIDTAMADLQEAARAIGGADVPLALEAGG